MKKLLLMCAALAVCATTAWAQAVGVDGKTPPEATSQRAAGLDENGVQRTVRTNASGAVNTTEQLPISDQNYTFPYLINNAALAAGGADSCQPQDTHRMRLGMIYLKSWANTGTGVDTTLTWRIAFQFRSHLFGQTDSSSTFAIYEYGVAPVMSAAAPTAASPDTAVAGHLFNPVALTGMAATPASPSAWSGEYVFVFTQKRAAHGSSVAVNGHTFYYPSGAAIPLSSLFGRDVYSPFTSIRARMLSTSAGAGVTVNLQVHLVGTPL